MNLIKTLHNHIEKRGFPTKTIMLFALVILASAISHRAGITSDNLISSGKAYGFIKRLNTNTNIVVIVPRSGVFNEGEKVIVFDDNGNEICCGKVKSVYKDEIYIYIDGDIKSNIVKGMVVAKNLTSTEVADIDESVIDDVVSKIKKEESESESAWNQSEKAKNSGRPVTLSNKRSEQIEYFRGIITNIDHDRKTLTVSTGNIDLHFTADENVYLRPFWSGDQVVVKYRGRTAISVERATPPTDKGKKFFKR